MPSFSPEQDAALKAVADWLKEKPGRGRAPLIFRLFGYAGTGKTTLAKHIAEGVDGKVLFAAFTGKAAMVMRSKGCHGRHHHPQPDLPAARSPAPRRRASNCGTTRRPRRRSSSSSTSARWSTPISGAI